MAVKRIVQQNQNHSKIIRFFSKTIKEITNGSLGRNMSRVSEKRESQRWFCWGLGNEYVRLRKSFTSVPKKYYVVLANT